MNKFLDNTGLTALFQIIKEWLNDLQSDIVGVLNGMSQALEEKADRSEIPVMEALTESDIQNIIIEKGNKEDDKYNFIGKFTDDSTPEERYIWINGKQTFFDGIEFKTNVESLSNLSGSNSVSNFSPKIEVIKKIPPLANKSLSLAYLFAGCTKLKSVDLSSWEVTNITSLQQMCYRCTSLETLILPNGKYTVSSLSNTFTYCSSLKTLDLSNFNTSNLTGAYQAFSGCSKLQTLNLNGWDFNRNNEMGGTFSSCSLLTDVTGPIYNIKTDMYLAYSPLLTYDSVMVFINGLAEVSETKKITFDKAIKLTSDDVAIATSKGWTVAGATIL